MRDPYLEWVARQGVPIVEDFGIDIRNVPVAPWGRYGMHGAFCHLKGRDDFLSIFAFELPPGGKSASLRHICEEVIYVISGHGSTVVTTEDGRKHSFEWGPKSLFSIPLNVRHQHFNGSGLEPARFASANNMIFVLNRFRNEEFIFNCPTQFPERVGGERYFAGEGEFIGIRPGRHQWETNFVADLSSFELKAWAARGAGGSMLRFMLADNTIGAHSSEMPVGTYKKGHRHFDGVCVFAVTGEGYSLLWHEDDPDFVRVNWEHGVVYCPPDSMFHQHFNVANHPSRYLALQIGTVRYPLLKMKREIWDVGVDKDVKQGGAQVEYEDQDPRIHKMWLQEIAKHGVTSGMGQVHRRSPLQPGRAMNESNRPAPAGKYLVDSYEDWAKGEGVPILTGAALDLLKAEVKPWARFGVNGAFCHLDGRDDFLTVFLIELPPNSGSAPHQHLYEAVCYVLSGVGTTEFQAPDGHTQVIEWGPRSLFALPMNAHYRHRNTSAEPARFATINDLRYLFNLYRSEKFVFETMRQFGERHGGTEVLVDLAQQPAGALTLAKGTISSDVVELAPGTYQPAFRQIQGAHLFGVDGEGYTLTWEEGAHDFAHVAWRHGVVTAMRGMSFQQHFNAGSGSARYLDAQLGSQQQPMFRHRRAAYGDSSVYAAGSASIPFAEQDPRIHKMWLETITAKGVTPRMPS